MYSYTYKHISTFVIGFSRRRYIIVSFIIFQNMLFRYSITHILDISASLFQQLYRRSLTPLTPPSPAQRRTGCLPHPSPALSSRLSAEGNKASSSLIDGECKSSVTILRCRRGFVSIGEILSPLSNTLAYYCIIMLESVLRLEMYLNHTVFAELVLHRTSPIVT